MKNSALYMSAAFIASLLLVGVPFWLIPYSSVNLPDALLTPWLAAPALAAFLLCLFRSCSYWRTSILIGASVPAAVLLRIIVEVTSDPTTHNLMPFEIIIALMLGLPMALLGALSGRLAARCEVSDGGMTRSSSGLRIIQWSLTLGIAGILPLLLYIQFGPSQGNPIGLGLLALAAIGLGGIGCAIGVIILLIRAVKRWREE